MKKKSRIQTLPWYIGRAVSAKKFSFNKTAGQISKFKFRKETQYCVQTISCKINFLVSTRSQIGATNLQGHSFYLRYHSNNTFEKGPL